jgi:hypothetical protein
VDEAHAACGWSRVHGRLGVRAPAPVAPGTALLIRIGSRTPGLDLALRGAAHASTRVGNAWMVEVVPASPADVALLDRLAEAHRGAAPPLRAREARFSVALPAVVCGSERPMFMQTVTVSERGCSLAWSGERPTPGALLAVRLGTERQGVVLRAQICWSRDSARGPRAGLRFVGDDLGPWLRLLGELTGGAAGAARRG